jgi:hypothetical protein
MLSKSELAEIRALVNHEEIRRNRIKREVIDRIREIVCATDPPVPSTEESPNA